MDPLVSCTTPTSSPDTSDSFWRSTTWRRSAFTIFATPAPRCYSPKTCRWSKSGNGSDIAIWAPRRISIATLMPWRKRIRVRRELALGWNDNWNTKARSVCFGLYPYSNEMFAEIACFIRWFRFSTKSSSFSIHAKYSSTVLGNGLYSNAPLPNQKLTWL